MVDIVALLSLHVIFRPKKSAKSAKSEKGMKDMKGRKDLLAGAGRARRALICRV
jgi:hypothetical protein